MKYKKLFIDMIFTFAITLVTSVVVTYLYNLIFHEAGKIQWETAFMLAITLSIVVPWVQHRERNKLSQ